MGASTKRILFWVVLGAGLAAGLAWTFRPQPVPVDLVTIGRAPLVVTVDEEGRTRVREVFVVSAPVMGHARRIVLEVGDTVRAGTTAVAEIEPNDPAFLDQRARAEAEADLAGAEAALALARAEVEQARAELDFARAEHERAQRLSDRGTISEQAVDDALRLFRTRRAALQTALAEVQVRSHALERARSRLTSPVVTSISRGDCECVVLTAPVDGRVLQVLHESAGVVAAGEPLLEIGDPTDMEIVVEMLSTEAVKVEPGMRAIIEGWGGDEPLPGVVERIEPFGFTKVSALGIEEQRVNTIFHGFRVDVRVVVWEADDVLTVPLTALFRSGDGWALFVDDQGTARQVSVQTGRRAGLRVEVTGGLDAGARVVVSPGERIADGTGVVERDS